MRWRLPLLGLYCVIAAAVVLPMYAMTLGYGFDYDDYHFVRPFPLAEVRAAFSGKWDPAGIEVPFFRPFTIVLYALRFHFFGVNSEAHHALSLVMFGMAAVLFGLLARGFLASIVAGAFAIVAFAVHPAMPYAAVAWITNQMHLLQLLVVLSALLYWFSIRRRPAVWWLPLVVFELAALLVKEDGVMLVPVILALHWLRRAFAERDLPHPPWRFVAVAASAGAAFLFYRSQVLQGIGGYGVPSLDQAWENYSRGLMSVVRLLPAKRPWQPEASWFVTVLPLAALASWRRCSGDVRFTLLAAVTVAAFFNLPFVFVVKVQQMHLVAMGAALLIAAAVAGLVQACRHVAVLAGIAAVSCAGVATLAVVARDITRDFEPFGTIILTTDDLVTGWIAVPIELRNYIQLKKQPHAATRLSGNPARDLDVVSFGLHPEESSPNGRNLRWMSGSMTELHVNARVHGIEIPLRHEIGVFQEPTTAVIEVNGRILDQITFGGDEWRLSSLKLRAKDVRWLSRMHRVVIRIPHAWVPATLHAGSQDTRTLGLQLGEVTFR